MSRVLKNAKNQITCGYSASHKAVDVVKYQGQTCYVIVHTEGKVVWVQTGQKHNPGSTGNASYGNAVKIKHPNGYFTLYAHLKNVKVKLGETVKTGQTLGYMGNTGNSYGAHLHFEVRDRKDNRINPTPYLDSNLPNVANQYQAYDNVKNCWLPWVAVGSNGYAGNFGNAISGIRCSNYEYRAHDRVTKKWLPWVKGSSGYAGNLPNDIDGFQIKGVKQYRVHLKNGGWLEWVYKVDKSAEGYAGIFGKSIDGVQIK